LSAGGDDTVGLVRDPVSVSWSSANRQHEAFAAGRARASSSSSSGVLRLATTPPNGWRRTAMPSRLSASSTPQASDAWAAREAEGAAAPVPVPEPLSPAETRVLGYLPSRLSLREIGDELYLSVNTIKVHVRHIYAKLEVNRRREAIERARGLGLL
jgi:ATP/maltotriose-dependent transcriptional regulator MalT